MLLWINLVTDGLPAIALSIDPYSKHIMKQPPKRGNGYLLSKKSGINILVIAGLITLAVLFVSYNVIRGNENEAYTIDKMQTMAFTLMAVLEIAIIQSVRGRYKLGPFSNKYLIGAVLISLGLQLAVIYTPLSKFFGTVPLSFVDWIYILGVSAIVYGLIQVYVIFTRKMEEKSIKT